MRARAVPAGNVDRAQVGFFEFVVGLFQRGLRGGLSGAPVARMSTGREAGTTVPGWRSDESSVACRDGAISSGEDAAGRRQKQQRASARKPSASTNIADRTANI